MHLRHHIRESMQHRLELLPQPGIGPHHIEIQAHAAAPLHGAHQETQLEPLGLKPAKPLSHARHPGGLQPRPPSAPRRRPAGRAQSQGAQLRHPDEPGCRHPGPALVQRQHTQPHQRERPGPAGQWAPSDGTARRPAPPGKPVAPTDAGASEPQSQRPAAGRHQGQRAPAPPGDAAAGRPHHNPASSKAQGPRRRRRSTGDLRSSSDADKYPCHEKCYFPDLSSASIRIVLSGMMACDHTKLEMS